MSRKTGTKWKTGKCARCFKEHSGYSGKLDANNKEYVVCQFMHKKLTVPISGWEKDE